MHKTTLSDATKGPFNLEGYIMHKSSSLEVIHLCLMPGENIAQHTNASDVVVCLVKGEVVLNQGNTSTSLGLYDVAEIAKNLQRGFTNTSDTESRLLILKKLA